MKNAEKALYSYAPVLMKKKLDRLVSRNANKEIEEIILSVPFEKIRKILSDVGYAPRLDKVHNEQLLKNQAFVDYAIAKLPFNIEYISDDMVKPYHIKHVIEHINEHNFIFVEFPPSVFKSDELVDALIDRMKYIGNAEMCMHYLNIIYKQNKKRVSDYVDGVIKNIERGFEPYIVYNYLDEEARDYIMNLPQTQRFVHRGVEFYKYFKEEELEKLSEEEKQNLIARIQYKHLHGEPIVIKSKTLFMHAIALQAQNIIKDGYIKSDPISLEDAVKITNAYPKLSGRYVLSFINPSSVNEDNLNTFMKLYNMVGPATYYDFLNYKDENLLNLMINNKIEAKYIITCFDKSMFSSEVLKRIYSYSSLSEIIRVFGARKFILHDFDVGKEKLLEKFNDYYSSLIGDLDYLNIVDLLFIVSKLKQGNKDEELEKKLNLAINYIKQSKRHAQDNYDELIDLIVAGERSPFVLINLKKENNNQKVIKYITKFDNIYDYDSLLTISCIPMDILEKVNRKHILEIIKLIKDLYGSEDRIKESDAIILAFNVYMTLGYERSVSFLSKDPKKNYGLVDPIKLKTMFYNVDLSGLLLVKKNNTYVPEINEQLINMVFGNSNKVVNTPIRNYLNKNAERLAVLEREKEAIRNDSSLSLEEKEAKIKEAEEKCQEYLKQMRNFIERFSFCVNKWDIIEEEFFKKENKSKLKLKITPAIINEIIDMIERNSMAFGLDEIKDQPLIDSEVFEYVGVDNQYVQNPSGAKQRAIQLSRRMDDVKAKKFPKIELTRGKYKIKVYDSQDRNILCAGHRSACCFRPNGNADDFGQDYSLLTYCTTTEYGGGVEIVDDKGKTIMFSPLLRNGNVLMIHSIETACGIDEECARLIEEFARKVIEESEKVGDNIEFVTLTNLHNTGGIKPLGMLPGDKEFRIFDEDGSFRRMYNNLHDAGVSHLVLAHKKGLTFDDISYGRVDHSYDYHSENVETIHFLNVTSKIVNEVAEIIDLQDEITDLSNERRKIINSDEKKAYELLSLIKAKKKLYIEKYSKLLKENKGVDFVKEIKRIIRYINDIDEKNKTDVRGLSSIRQIIYNKDYCILIDESGKQTVIARDTVPPEAINRYQELYKQSGDETPGL